MPPTDSNKSKPSVLKNTREAKGLTLEIVHEATKIPMDALRAIEEGYSVRILSPFYYRGFIKIYAEFLGLDVGETYQQYGLDQPPKPTSSATVSAKAGPAAGGASQMASAGPNVVLEQLQEWVAFVFKPKNIKIILKVIVFLLLFLLLFKMGGCIASHMNKKVEKKVRVYNYNEVEAPKAVPAPPKIKHEVVQAPSDNHKVEVAVRAIKNTWIQVKTDGNVVFQMTLSKGSMESWSADSRIELSGKNIEQLDMEVNGKHIGSLGGGERRIRKVVITQEGLTVKK
jgi:hypothetical protein